MRSPAVVAAALVGAVASAAYGVPAGASAGGSGAGAQHARSVYIERCAGCHGFDGRSVAKLVPDLKDRAGFFLCDADARAYVGRLPNVVFSNVSDAELAALLNYVVFDLGATSASARARPYTSGELARARLAPLSSTDLKAYRQLIVDRLVAQCGAPSAFRTEYAPDTPQHAGR